MADFEKAIPIILKWEGGYVNHPSDPGGATNRGIIFTLYKQYCLAMGLSPTIEGLKNLTENQAKFIYQENFWNRMKGDLIKDQQLANIIFDGYVNMGGRTLKMWQQCAGVDIDGVIGPNTLAVTNMASGRVLFDCIKDRRTMYYKDLAERKPSMKVFLKGWLNRINSFTYQVEGPIGQ